MDTFRRLYQSENGPLRNNCFDSSGASGSITNFYDTLHYCLEDKVTDESETTTSGQFGNLFDAYDYDSFEKYKSLEDLINATKIDITDILKSFTFGSYIFNSQFVADAKESFEADWKTNLHHLYGHCHTFDHSRMDKLEKVKVITKAENEVSGSLFQSFLLFDVSSLFPILN